VSAPPGRPRVLVGLLSERLEFQRLQAEDARSTAARRGLDVEVVFAENNAVLQIQQLYRAIHRPPEDLRSRRPDLPICAVGTDQEASVGSSATGPRRAGDRWSSAG